MKLTVHGRTAYAYTGGKPFDASLPGLVFIHGAACDHTVWTLLARWFAHHGHAVLAVDLPGHRRSDGPPLPSVEAMADWTWALMDAAGLRTAALAGHSMGSLVALEMAARQPERATHLAMLGTCVPMPVPQALLDLSLADLPAAIDRVVGFSFSTLAAKPSFPGPGTWLRGAGRSLMRQVTAADPRLFHTDFLACHTYARGLDAALQVRCPAALVLGSLDQMTLPRAATEVAQRLKATVHTVPGGHFLMQECPDATLNALRALLRTPSTSPLPTPRPA